MGQEESGRLRSGEDEERENKEKEVAEESDKGWCKEDLFVVDALSVNRFRQLGKGPCHDFSLS